jgi:DNA-directed RNA polymerase specialized sigma24 family protein
MARKRDGDAGLTGASFGSLLARLDPDPERGAAAYETLRETLVRFFDWRGAWSPEDCADQALDRLARKVEDGTRIEDVRRFALGIARMVLLEQWRSPAARLAPAAEGELRRLAAPQPAPEEPLRECLHRCLAELPAESRELILQYYAGDRRDKIEARARAAAALGLTDNALRSRAQRVRDRLERCIGRCVGVDTNV